MNKTVFINLAENSYDITIDSCFNFESASEIIKNRKIAIISNEIVAPLYLDSLKQALNQYVDIEIIHLILKDGEQHKNLQQWQQIIDFLAEHQINRSDLLVSLGGGVICDMTGFAAASWMRGIDFIQVPTTLLAQVDASVGGKTGINHLKGKNLIGAFHQPKAVIINTETLKSLPEREFKAGIGEAVKYGFINQPQFIQWLLDQAELINHHDSNTLADLIAQCCQFKADIVEQDEKESGIRALLNLGHTFAHAIETLTLYKEYLHGEAVAIGMVMAAELSELLLKPKSDIKAQLIKVLQKLKLNPYLNQALNPQKLVELMRLDKKASQNNHKLIVMDAIGSSSIKTNIDEELIVKSITECMKACD